MKNQAEAPVRARRRSERGLSLIELLITVAILAIITGPTLMIFYQSESSFRAQSEQGESIQQMRLAMDQICRVIRQAGNDPVADIGVPPVTILGEGSIRVASDITGSVPSITGNSAESTGDPDGTLNSVFELVTFRHDSGQQHLLADVGYGEGVLAEGITDLSFQFLDLNGNLTNDPAEIVRVRIEMVGATENVDLQMGERYTITLQSEVFLRNRMPQVLPEGV